MKKLANRFLYIFTYLWLLYFVFSIFQTVYDVPNIKNIKWQNAENISSVYNGSKATIVTKAYKKDFVVEREYPYFGLGLNNFLSGIDKTHKTVDINFFVKEKDFQSIKLKNKKQSIPYFSIRGGDLPASKFLVFLDIWKYNYNTTIAFLILFAPMLIIYIVKWLKKSKQPIEDYFNNTDLNLNYIYILFVIVLILRFAF
ncbi:hypothetical protein [Soonwooa sp.]|uniref:hypothetical protein n=1 Tax=Soonwooa sp. TaxID=1938592 RepID=UPI0026258508|nr:hypothetical protein [Soonwooa sp.]